MPKVSSKRQITLPARQCRAVGIKPGDEYQSFVANGRITIIRQEPGIAAGCLSDLVGDDSVSDYESLMDTIEQRRLRALDH